MSTIIPYEGKAPRLHESVYVAEGARITGDVEIGRDSSVWFNTVIRGDVNWVKIGEETNIQDGSVLHITERENPLSIGNRVTVGHMVMLHGCTIEDLALIGIGSIVLDGAVIGREAFIGAGSLVTPRTKIPPRTLCMGRPCKPVRELRPEELAGLVESARHYVEYARVYKKNQAR